MKCKESDLLVLQLKKQVSKNELVDQEWQKTIRNMLIQHRKDLHLLKNKVEELQTENGNLKNINTKLSGASKADADAFQSLKLEILCLIT